MAKSSFTVVRNVIPRKRVSIVNDEPSRTVQSAKQECDINFILRNYQKTGMLEHINKYQAQYGEVPSHDFREALEIVKQAQTVFDALPSNVRNRFANDPAQFLSFCENPANLSEAKLLGLAKPDTAPSDLQPPPAASAS